VGSLDQQVVLITGAARGQGRAQVCTSAEEGADVVLVDIASPIDEIAYPAAIADDLAETAHLVQAGGRWQSPVTLAHRRTSTWRSSRALTRSGG
jgi:NAD(P)-dependent dehydrogenase (short-subunit alcohol dehydrogenase family)